MIEIHDLVVDVNNRKIINNIDISFGKSGLICLVGESGSGKTTFLNCTSGLIKYNGSIKFDGIEIANLSDEERANFRLKNIGFVFQDFKLFEYQSVLDNISMPLQTLSNMDKTKILRRSNDLLKIVGLDGYENRKISFLSGGEKQRVAIARSFINSPKVILADEPTGSLDSKNSIAIMDVLKTLSQKTLIICVTHDEKLAKEYADQIVRISDGTIVNVENLKNSFESIADRPFSEGLIYSKKPSLPINFALSQIKQSMSMKKIRSGIGFLFMSLALLGVGLSLGFSSSISNSIKRAYGNLIESSEISLQKKRNDSPKFITIAKEEAIDLMQEKSDLIDEVGIVYKADFEYFFKDKDELSFVFGNKHSKLEGFSSRNINEFLWMKEVEAEIFPKNVILESDDEIILGLTIKQIRTVCYMLGIDMNIKSLESYLSNNDIPLVFEFANNDWEYWDEQEFIMKGFCLTNEPFICSNNAFWNEEVFENRMRFPTNEEYLYNEYPWILEKLTYISSNNIDELLKYFHSSNTYSSFLYDLCDKSYFPLRHLNTPCEKINKLILFHGNDNYITPKEIKYIKGIDDKLTNEILYNSGSYVSYPSNLLNGFLNKTYFSFDNELLEKTMESNSDIVIEDNEREILPKGVISSHFSQTFENPVKFRSKFDNLLEGREPIDCSEIVISNGLHKLLIDEDLNGDYLYISTVTSEINLEYGVSEREYCTNKVKIVGITDNEKPVIYHSPYWTIDFYVTHVGISIFNLLPSVISFSLDNESKKDSIINKLELAVPQYKIFNPLNDINNSVDNLCNTISKVVMCIALISLVTSIILLSSIHYLNLQDMRKDIALMRCIGITKKDSCKFLYLYTAIVSFISFCIASIELVFTCAVLSLSLSNELSVGFELYLNPISFLTMFGVSIIFSIGISIAFSKKVIKIEPLECLRT